MKKILCCLLVLATVFSFAFGSAAWAEEAVRYDFQCEQGTLSMDIDESMWFLVTRDNITEKLDPEKADIQSLLDDMNENSVIAEGSIVYENTDTTFDMHLYQFALGPEEAADFRELSAAEIAELTEAINGNLLASGYEILLGADMRSTKNQLMHVYYEYCSEGYHAMDYVFSFGDVLYQFRFECQEAFVLEEYEAIDAIVENLSFTEPVSAAPESEAAPERSFRMPTALDVLINFVLTVTFYSLPIIIYRYLIRKAPVENKKAKKITIIYAIAAYALVLALMIYMDTGKAPGSAIILWSYINYRMLTN